jgi:hypothetical protein
MSNQYRVYKLDRDIETLLDIHMDENGVLSDKYFSELENLQTEKEDLFLNIGKEYKNINEIIVLHKQKIEVHKEHIERLSSRAEKLKNYLSTKLDTDTKIKDIECQISWHKSEKIELNEDFDILDLPIEYIKIDKSPKKVLLKKAIKDGEAIEGVSLVHSQSLVIK